MLSPNANVKIYLCTGHTDMRKGMNGLSLLSDQVSSGAVFVFRGKNGHRQVIE